MAAQAGASHTSARAGRGRVPAAKDPGHREGPRKNRDVPGDPCGVGRGGPREAPPHSQAFPPGAGPGSDFQALLCQLSLCLVDLRSSLLHASPLDTASPPSPAGSPQGPGSLSARCFKTMFQTPQDHPTPDRYCPGAVPAPQGQSLLTPAPGPPWPASRSSGGLNSAPGRSV